MGKFLQHFANPYCANIGKQAVITGYENEEDCAPAYLLDVDDSFWSWNEDMLENPE